MEAAEKTRLEMEEQEKMRKEMEELEKLNEEQKKLEEDEKANEVKKGTKQLQEEYIKERQKELESSK